MHYCREEEDVLHHAIEYVPLIDVCVCVVQFYSALYCSFDDFFVFGNRCDLAIANSEIGYSIETFVTRSIYCTKVLLYSFKFGL